MFLSFPHISVDALGRVGEISRPGRPGQSCACGALNAALGDIKAGGLRANCKKPGGAGSKQNCAPSLPHHAWRAASHALACAQAWGYAV